MSIQLRPVLERFFSYYMNERNLEKTVSCVAENIISIGTGEHETAVGKEAFTRLYRQEFELAPDPLAFELRGYTEHVYNDNFGHQTGDILISCFGKLLRKTYRKVDFISRFGGDEFVIILPNTNLQAAVRAGERLRKALEDARFFIPELERFLGRRPEVSADNLLGFSGGICCNLDMPDSGDVAGVLAASDKALRYAKKTGKNRVCCYNDVPAEER